MSNWARPIATLCWAAMMAAAPVYAQLPGQIRIATSHLPPLSIEPTPATPGALFEVVEELSRRTGVAASIEFVPWKRALYLGTNLPRSAIFPLTRSPEREHQFRWLARLYHEQFLFMARKDSKNFDVSEPLRYKQRRIGLLRGSLMLKVLKESGYHNIVEASSVGESVRFLQRGIVDAAFGDRAVLNASLDGRARNDYVMSEALHTTTTWLGGSLDFSQADAALFQKAMDEMIADGSYAAILKKYHLAPGP